MFSLKPPYVATIMLSYLAEQVLQQVGLNESKVVGEKKRTLTHFFVGKPEKRPRGF